MDTKKIVAIVGMAFGVMLIAGAVVISRIRETSDFGGTTFTLPPPPPPSPPSQVSPIPVPMPLPDLKNPLQRIVEEQQQSRVPKAPLEKVAPQDAAKIKETFQRDPSSKVSVIVWLDERFLAPEDRTKGVIEAVIQSFSEGEFSEKYRYLASKGFAGSVSMSGYEKLLNDPRVSAIFLDGVVYIN